MFWTSGSKAIKMESLGHGRADWRRGWGTGYILSNKFQTKLSKFDVFTPEFKSVYQYVQNQINKFALRFATQTHQKLWEIKESLPVYTSQILARVGRYFWQQTYCFLGQFVSIQREVMLFQLNYYNNNKKQLNFAWILFFALNYPSQNTLRGLGQIINRK